ncbi:MAG TPA: hypothetical protein PKE12_10410 [Kiritimatiellia bacterium]|nr:hypothetical protein [Kiritimatiellia bacterium]
MNRIALRAFAVALYSFGALARAEDAAVSKKARPPADYSGRVQLHELPATVAPPKLPDAKDDPMKIDSRSPSAFGERAIPLSMIPPAPGAPADETPSSLRDLMNENWRNGDSRGGRSGWGWLADDIATNRARRAGRDAESSREGRVDELEQRSLLQTNIGAPNAFLFSAGDTDPTNGAPSRAGGDMRPALEPVLGWVRGLPSGESERNTERPRAPGDDTRATADTDRDRDWTRTDPMRGWSAPPTVEDRAGDGLSALGAPNRLEPSLIRPVYGARDDDEEESARAAERSSSGADRLNVDLLAGNPLETTSWASPTFAPFSLAPTEPLSLAPTPITPSISLSTTESSTPSLGGMGSAREQAAPKTLPW